jgi:hypothetical protein
MAVSLHFGHICRLPSVPVNDTQPTLIAMTFDRTGHYYCGTGGPALLPPE